MWALAFNQKQRTLMRQNKLNEHGQPFSKKQKKASRVMMSLRGGFIPKDPTFTARAKMTKEIHEGFLTGLMAMMRMGRRRAKG